MRSARRKAMARTKSKSKRKRWVVKAGSNLICTGGPLLIRSWATQIAALKKQHDIEVVWVTSGAIATATERTGFGRGKRTLAEKQALSAVGQPLVMDLYNLSLQTAGLLGAQVLLTSDDLADRERKQNFQNTIEVLLKWDATPVLNENDAVATEEIRFGDNDSLSARVARAVGADRLVILTDVEGLYESDPRSNPNARLIPWLPGVSPSQIKKVFDQSGKRAGSSRGTGGMHSKLMAAKLATSVGIDTWLVKGDLSSVLIDVARERTVGTRIEARRKRR